MGARAEGEYPLAPRESQVHGTLIVPPERAAGKPRAPGLLRPGARGCSGSGPLLLQPLPALDLLLERLAVHDLELHAAVLRHVERRRVRDQRPAGAVALGRELRRGEARELVDEVVLHRLGARLGEHLVLLRAT